jgi:steroid 5-alpha reductase family enzyme
LKTGKDSRFDKIKVKPTRFTIAWAMQGTWVTLIGLPVWLVNAVSVAKTRPWGPWDTAFITLAALSLTAEVIADRQKSVWRERKEQGKHQEKFLSTGLWAWSRHPKLVFYLAFRLLF